MVAALLTTSMAWAQSTPDRRPGADDPAARRSAPTTWVLPVRPPRALSIPDVEVARPAGDLPQTVLELTVDEEGSVVEARAVAGDGPEAEIARAAALAWRFDPAERAGKPVRARVRVLVPYRFVEPGEARAHAGGGGAGASPPRRPDERPIEVSVHGDKRARATHVVSREEVRQVPGTFGDPVRIVDAMPGAAPIVSGLPYVFVRGAPPGNTGFFFDGVRVPTLFHLGIGPSVVSPGLVDRVDYYPGSAPTEYGRFAGPVVSVEPKPPAAKLHGEGNVRLFDAGALVESPFGKGKGRALAAGRYSYAGLLLPLFAPDTRLGYWDYQGRVTWDLGPKDTIGVLGFGTLDTLKQRDEATNAFEEELGFSFHRVDVRFDHRLPRDGRVRAAVTLGADESSQRGLSATKELARIRVQADHTLSDSVSAIVGADAQIARLGFSDVSQPAGTSSALYPPRADVVWGMHGAVSWRLHPRVLVTPGLRLDVFSSAYDELPDRPVKPAVDPRLAIRGEITREVATETRVGLAHQPPSSFVALPGLEIGRLQDGLQRGTFASQGVEIAWPLGITSTVTGFLQRYEGLLDATSTCRSLDFDPNDVCAGTPIDGRAYGAEFMLRRKLTENIAGWVSYTLSRSVRDIKPEGPSGPILTVPSEIDRPHVLSAVVAVRLPLAIRASSRFVAYTGRPYSRLYASGIIPPYNAQRLDGFERLDVRLERAWRIGDTGQIALVAEAMNILFSEEAVGVACEWTTPPGAATPDFNAPPTPLNGCVQRRIGPITIPSVGVEGRF